MRWRAPHNTDSLRTEAQDGIVMSDFEAIAQKYGHDLDALRAGEKSTRTIVINNLDELKEFMGDDIGADESDALRRGLEAAYGGDLDPSVQTVQGITRRAEAYVMSGQPLSEQDQATIASMFPMKAQSTCIETCDLTTVEDLGTTTSPVGLCIKNLNISPGGAFKIQNTVLTLNVTDTVTIVGGAPPSGAVNYHLGVFGATGAIGAVIPPAAAAQAGPKGVDGNCTVSGSEPGQQTTPGLTGAAGVTGAQGNPGGNGKPSLTATVTLAGITGGQFVVKTVSGTGGQGGPGQQGQQGGAGGTGGQGIRCECTGVNSSNGGTGGTGGRGGTGGTGGNAVAGTSVRITVPTADLALIAAPIRLAAPTGPGGEPGGFGPAGLPGAGGSGAKHSQQGATGGAGHDGSPGPRGDAGPGAEGGPGQVFINGDPTA